MRSSSRRPSRWSRRFVPSGWPWALGVALFVGFVGEPRAHAQRAPTQRAPTQRAQTQAAGVRKVDGSARDEGELARDVALLEEAWRAHGAVTRGTPRLLHRGDRYPLVLPAEALAEDPGCTTVAVLAARNVSFVVTWGEDGGLGRSLPLPSRAGVVELTRCGPRRTRLDRLAVQMRSPHGVVEWAVALSKGPLAPTEDVLPHRQMGPAATAPPLGPRPALPPVAERAQAFERRARREGAIRVVRTVTQSDGAGRGAVPLRLPAGCHRVDVLAEGASSPGGGTDVDAVLHDLESGEEIFRDDSESGQASLDWCSGGSSSVQVTFVGAPSSAPVELWAATWPLPRGLPPDWGDVARGRLAHAVGRDALPALTEGPVYASLGVQGHTRLPLSVEPGTCYLVAVASLRGVPSALALGVQAGATRRENHAERGGSGVALSFCSGARSNALLEVRSSGAGLAWVLGVWRVGPEGALPEAGGDPS